MLTTYLNTLKNQGNFTTETIAKMSGVPEGTVKNILSGKTEDPRFETVYALVTAMGGSLDAISAAASTSKVDVEGNSVITLKETYDQRLQEIREHYQMRINDMEKHYEQRIEEINEHIKTIQLDKRWFRIATCICAFALVVLFITEILTPGLGWVRWQ